ncbi:MAG: DUF1800 domain-containing protein [Armatimonadetes bacterium]|nr:DUF1800 domain-containing protein [Armatimonadota bacterium]
MPLKTESEKVAHLLRRFGLGASEAELDFYGDSGYAGAVEKLLSYESREDSIILDELLLRDNDGRVIQNPRLAQVATYAYFLATSRPLEAKMTLFWHDHFATSAQKVSNGPTMYRHLNLLRENATGNFYEFLVAVSKDPAMLYWLDNHLNLKGRANENFAREVMELFTLGVGNYTEKDIQEAARAFTGWTYGLRRGARIAPAREEVPNARSVYLFDEPNHDFGSKTFFGKTGNWNGDDILRMLSEMPRTAYYLTEKIWEWFVYPKPSKAVVEKHAALFQKSGLEIKALVKSIMLDPEFVSDRAERAIIKNPIDYCASMIRQMGLGAPIVQNINAARESGGNIQRGGMLSAARTNQSTSTMGMVLLEPPDVAGWPAQEQWISTATMIERITWGSELFMGANGRPTAYPAFSLFAANPTTAGVINALCSLFDVTLPAAKRQVILDAVAEKSGGSVTRQNANQIAADAMKLICATPEFQFM